MKGFVYLLESIKDCKRYIGSTVDIKRRLKEHQMGLVKSTSYRLPMILIGYMEVPSIEEAAMWEKRFKKSHDLLERMIKSGKFATGCRITVV